MLSKAFYKKIDSLCSTFLWKNNTQSALGARVAWEDVCKPRCEGGLGIRKLEDFEVVFRLKQVWNLFAISGSLWVAWVQRNVFGHQTFWATQYSNRYSITIKSMLQLKPLLSTFLKCEVRNGRAATFWYDSWTTLGPLIDFIGDVGPRMMRLRLHSKVIDAVRDGNWHLPNARSDQAQTLQILLTTLPTPTADKGPDLFLWRGSSGTYSSVFSSKGTWEQLRTSSPQVRWSNAVWFREAIPKASFILWLVLLRRLPTRDRLRGWGMNVSDICPFCSLKTHDHLFVACPYSHDLWSYFVSPLNAPFQGCSTDHILDAILDPVFSASTNMIIILQLLFQVIVYALWRERNARIFTATTTPTCVMKRLVDRTMRDRLLSFPSKDASPSLLEFYFSCFSTPL